MYYAAIVFPSQIVQLYDGNTHNQDQRREASSVRNLHCVCVVSLNGKKAGNRRDAGTDMTTHKTGEFILGRKTASNIRPGASDKLQFVEAAATLGGWHPMQSAPQGCPTSPPSPLRFPNWGRYAGRLSITASGQFQIWRRRRVWNVCDFPFREKRLPKAALFHIIKLCRLVRVTVA